MLNVRFILILKILAKAQKQWYLQSLCLFYTTQDVEENMTSLLWNMRTRKTYSVRSLSSYQRFKEKNPSPFYFQSIGSHLAQGLKITIFFPEIQRPFRNNQMWSLPVPSLRQISDLKAICETFGPFLTNFTLVRAMG